MKVQRLIEKYKKLEGVWDAEGAELARQIFLQDLEQLDEPEKITIPQFVADWIRKCKTFKNFIASLSFALQPVVWAENSLSDECIDWLMNADNQETFARAWLDGYEVEEENQYAVTLKNRQPLVKSQSGSILYFSQDITAGNYKITRKELEDADFGWVFDCPGIEVEEVE